MHESPVWAGGSRCSGACCHLLSVCHEIIPTPDRLILDQFDPSEHDGDGPERQKSNAGAVRWLRIRACHNNPFNGYLNFDLIVWSHTIHHT